MPSWPQQKKWFHESVCMQPSEQIYTELEAWGVSCHALPEFLSVPIIDMRLPQPYRWCDADRRYSQMRYQMFCLSLHVCMPRPVA